MSFVITNFALSGSAAFPPPADSTDAKDQGSSQRKQKVLVVDDEALIADSMAEILNRNGFEAIATYSGSNAIDLAREMCPDIVMSDVLMPRINGVQAAIAILENCPTTRVLLFSGQAATADILQKARAAGHEFELLPKPIHPQQLINRLRS
ncbi:MAG TPA: response regulator [Terriglobales bacterium]|jgi:CheY-like chemotaxis protein|nr:response regulator [Terriglobales bacterium]